MPAWIDSGTLLKKSNHAWKSRRKLLGFRSATECCRGPGTDRDFKGEKGSNCTTIVSLTQRGARVGEMQVNTHTKKMGQLSPTRS